MSARREKATMTLQQKPIQAPMLRATYRMDVGASREAGFHGMRTDWLANMG